MPQVFIKGKGARKFKKHLNDEHPEVHAVVLKKKKSSRRKY